MSDRLRLTVVTHYFAEHGGGIELVAGRLCEDLAMRHGHSVRWFASRTDAQTSNAESPVDRVAVRCWNGIERWTGLPYPLWGVPGLRALARAIAASDAVHVHDFSYFGSLAAARIARARRVPLLLTQHTGAVRTGSRVFAALYGVGERTIGRGMFATAAAVTCVSETTRAHWRPMVRDETRLQTVWNGLDFDATYGVDDRERARCRSLWGVAGERPVVLFVGRRIRKKGIEIVHGVARAMPKVTFLIAGQGPVDPEHWALPNVRTLGYVASERVGELYEAADVLLLPSYAEGFPLVVQEALVRGTAILSTEEVAAACPPVADSIAHCPVPQRDDSGPWNRALERLLAEGIGTADRVGRAERARGIWSRARCAAEYDAILRRIAAARSNRGAAFA